MHISALVTFCFVVAQVTVASFVPEGGIAPMPVAGDEAAGSSTAGKTRRKTSQRIVGGHPAVPYAYPSIVAVQVDGNTECGGTIIRPEWVLTAAHCIGKRDVKLYTVTAGEHRRSVKEGFEQFRKVVKIITHEQYDKVQDTNDIALFKVSPPFNYNDKVNQAIMAPKKYQPADFVKVAGWGAMKDGANKGSDALMQVELPVIDDLECQRKYKNYIILQSQMCTLKAGGGQDACQGDSGGPVYSVNDLPILVGIVSWGEGCAQENKPGVFTEVSYYLDWINKHVNSN